MRFDICFFFGEQEKENILVRSSSSSALLIVMFCYCPCQSSWKLNCSYGEDHCT